MSRVSQSRPFALAILFLLAACGDGKSGSASEQDSALSRDLTLAANPTPLSQPQLQDVPLPQVERPMAETRPVVRRPAPRPSAERERQRRPEAPERPAPAPERPREAPPPVEVTPAPTQPSPTPNETPAATPAARMGRIASGTSMTLVTAERACSNGHRPGDKMVARLAETVTGSNGLVFPEGSPAVIEIATIVQTENEAESVITFRVKSITVNDVTHLIHGDVLPVGTLEKTRVATRGNDKKTVIGGAIAGAIIGQVIGKDARSTAVGAAAGAAAGTAIAMGSAKYVSCLPAGATLRLTLAEPIEVAL